MKNLGRILFFITIFLGISLYGAGVVATVDNPVIQEGDSVTLHLKISGKDISRPSISTLCGADIESSSSQTSIEMINMEYKKSYILSYKFSPKADCTIAPIEFKVGSKLLKTKPIKIKVNPYTRSANDDFLLSLALNKKNLYVGEPFELTLTLKQKKGAMAVDSKFDAPDFEGFWLKHESKPKRSDVGDSIVTKVIYTLAPQRSGTLKIKPAVMSIASRVASQDAWGSFMQDLKWRKYLSNSLDVDVKELPKGIKLVGDFTLNVRVDKKTVDANQPLNLVVEVSGYGNLEDIESFKPTIDGVSVFAEKVKIDGLLLTQKIALVADSNYTIPSFKLLYFDPQTKTRKLLRTKPIQIKVKNAPKQKEALVVKKEKVQQPIVVKEVKKQDGLSLQLSLIFGVIIFVIGIFVGVVLMKVKPFQRSKKSDKISLKDDKTILIKLMPFKDDKEVAKMIEMLEKSLYSTSSEEVDRKKLKELVKRYLRKV
jgi:hypothetical protein